MTKKTVEADTKFIIIRGYYSRKYPPIADYKAKDLRLELLLRKQEEYTFKYSNATMFYTLIACVHRLRREDKLVRSEFYYEGEVMPLSYAMKMPASAWSKYHDLTSTDWAMEELVQPLYDPDLKPLRR